MNLLAALVLASSSFGNSQARIDSIFWCSQRPLVWSDYKINREEIGASTTAVIVHRWVKTRSGFVLQVKAVFYRERCSYNPSDTTRDLLNHEARHFDIAELVARKARKDLLGRTFTDATRKQAFETLRNMNQDHKILNQLYDSESGHGQDKKGQSKWNYYISSQLKSLEQYSVDCKQSSL